MPHDQFKPQLDILLCGTSAEGQRIKEALVSKGYTLHHVLGETSRPSDPTTVQFDRDTHAVSLVIDVAHPFDAASHHRAEHYARHYGCALWHLDRPEWDARHYNAQSFSNFAQALEAIPTKARVFVATGYEDVRNCLARSDAVFFIRQIDKYRAPIADHITFLQSDAPFSTAQEVELLHSLGITHLIIRNGGGQGARPKIDAASSLNIDLLFIARPQSYFTSGTSVTTFTHERDLIEHVVALSGQ